MGSQAFFFFFFFFFFFLEVKVKRKVQGFFICFVVIVAKSIKSSSLSPARFAPGDRRGLYLCFLAPLSLGPNGDRVTPGGCINPDPGRGARKALGAAPMFGATVRVHDRATMITRVI